MKPLELAAATENLVPSRLISLILDLMPFAVGCVIGQVAKNGDVPQVIPMLAGVNMVFEVGKDYSPEGIKATLLETVRYTFGAAIPYIPEIYQAVENFIN